MKYSFILIILSGLISCDGRTTDRAGRGSERSIETYDSSRNYALGLINGSITPNDNYQTLSWVDSFHAMSNDTRKFAYQVYSAIGPKSDGALSEAISESINKTFRIFTGEFLELFISASPKVKERIINDICFEYSLNETNATEIRQDFQHFREDCKGCNLKALEDLKDSVILRTLRNRD